MRPLLATAYCLVLGLALASCTSARDATLSWSFSFANSGTAQRAEYVEVQILSGSCSDGRSVYRAEVSRAGSAPVPPNLPAGQYALWGRAVDDDCQSIARGCLEVTLPATDGSRYEVVLADTTMSQVCEGSCIESCGGDGDGDGDSDGDAGSAGDGDVSGDGDTPGDGDVSGDGDGTLPDAGGDGDGDVDAGPGDPCLDGRSRPGGHCYRFVTEQALSFADAETDCVSWGGHLVSFNDADEELWVYEQSLEVSGFANPIRYWIGFTDSDTETLWAWTDGSTQGEFAIVTYDLDDASSVRFKVRAFNDIYTHWGPNLGPVGNSEPNNGNPSNPAGQNPGEDCAESNSDRISMPGGVDPRPSWDDRNCNDLKFYVCER